MGIRAYVSDHKQSPAGKAALGIGSARHLSPECALRAAATIRTGVTSSLARPIDEQDGIVSRDGQPMVGIVPFTMPDGSVDILMDRMSIWAHGMVVTHLDAPNHIVIDGEDPATGDAQQSDQAWLRWSESGFVTRGVFFDVPAHRGEDFVTGERPITRAELEEMEDRLDAPLRPGDALLLYGGRDVYERTWTGSGPAPLAAAVAHDVAEWVIDRQFSVLCWDVLDSPPTDAFGVHLLIWADGLAIVDNCDYSPVVETFRSAGRSTAMLSVAPVPIKMSTGCLVNPIIVF